MRGPVEDPWLRRLLLDGDTGTLETSARRLTFVPLLLQAVPFDVAARVVQLTLARALQARAVLPPEKREGVGPLFVAARAPRGRFADLAARLGRACRAPWVLPDQAVEAVLLPAAGQETGTELSGAYAQLSRLKYGCDWELVRKEQAEAMESLAIPLAALPLLADSPIKGLMYGHARSCGGQDVAESERLSVARLAPGYTRPLLELPDELW